MTIGRQLQAHRAVRHVPVAHLLAAHDAVVMLGDEGEAQLGSPEAYALFTVSDRIDRSGGDVRPTSSPPCLPRALVWLLPGLHSFLAIRVHRPEDGFAKGRDVVFVRSDDMEDGEADTGCDGVEQAVAIAAVFPVVGWVIQLDGQQWTEGCCLTEHKVELLGAYLVETGLPLGKVGLFVWNIDDISNANADTQMCSWWEGTEQLLIEATFCRRKDRLLQPVSERGGCDDCRRRRWLLFRQRRWRGSARCGPNGR